MKTSGALALVTGVTWLGVIEEQRKNWCISVDDRCGPWGGVAGDRGSHGARLGARVVKGRGF